MKKIYFTVLLSCLALFSTAFFAPKGYKIGDKVADFQLINIDNSAFSLSSVKNAQGYIIVFTSNSCPESQKYERRIIDLHTQYNAKGYTVIAINPNDPSVNEGESVAEMKKRAVLRKYPFVYLSDVSGKLANTFGVQTLPQVYVLDKDKVVQYIGAIDDSADNAVNVKNKYVEAAIEALLEGKTPEKTTVKLGGCAIVKKGVEP